MNILENISLKQYNTFGIDVKAKEFAAIRSEEELFSLAESGSLTVQNPFFLGGGSNVLFVEDFNGIIVHSAIRGMKIIDSDDDTVILEVGAGEKWHDFVTIALKNSYFGLENLALIPGTVGAAPVQNIGAYGVEQKDFFLSLRGLNLETLEFEELGFDDCKFDYRDSVFKHGLKNKFVITSVKYKLKKNEKPNLSYSELRRETEKFSIDKPDAQFVYDTVCRLRMSKLPVPEYLGNAGSFFKNPAVELKKFEELKNAYPGINGYKQKDGKIKLSAAWLIEQCGWKGKRIGDAGVFDKHALIIVNYGNASGSDIYELSEQIIKSVFDKFGIYPEREVLVIGSI
jgi:UDP-N-acetylmuramate dehydrogenase